MTFGDRREPVGDGTHTTVTPKTAFLVSKTRFVTVVTVVTVIYTHIIVGAANYWAATHGMAFPAEQSEPSPPGQ